jgi:glycosyltransferase involved in cell wall biosynthesis
MLRAVPGGEPSISVVIPAFNAGRWIGETLEAVLGQTRQPEEVIVVDDGSTDDTFEQASRFNDRARLVRQANKGAPGAYNRGFAEATADYVAMCPADDIWTADKLAGQTRLLVSHPAADIVFGRAREFGIAEAPVPPPPRPGRYGGREMFELLYEENVIPAPTALVRRELHERLGRFREDLYGEDYEFWLRAAAAGAEFLYEDRVVVSLRKHGGNLSSQALPMWTMQYDVHRHYADQVDDATHAARVLARDLKVVGRCKLGLGEVEGAHEAFRGSIGHRPSLGALGWYAVTGAPGAGGLLRWVARRRRRASFASVAR